jgi:putative ABC transport system permease protein
MDHRRWFRRVLKLLPAEFRADYGDDMERTFEAQRREAGRERGGVVRLWAETVRDLVRTAPREHAAQVHADVRYAVRSMRRRPGLTMAPALVFAIGVAATTAVFSLVDATLLRPVPYAHPDRLVAVREITPDDTAPWELSYVSYLELRQANAFAPLAAYMRNGVVIGGAEPELADSSLISANLFDTLGIRLVAGRAFTDAEDAPGGAPVAIVGEALARQRYGSADGAVNRAVTIDGQPLTIVGVLPEAFRFPDGKIAVWLPIGQLANQPWMRDRAVHVALVVGRLRDGATVDQANAEAGAWMSAVQAREPTADPRHRVMVRTLADQLSAGVRPAVRALAGAVLLLLVATCASVTLLLLTHSAARSGELAIRLSLGATRARLGRQLVTEAMCIAALGAAGGLVAAPALLAFLAGGLADALPPLVTPAIHARAVAVAMAAAIAAALVSGLVPAAQALKMARPNATRRRGITSYFVAAQVAVCCVLLVLAALLGRSLDRLLRVDLGFRSERMLVMRVTAPAAGYQKPGQMAQFYEAALARLTALPGVAGATGTNRPPLQDGSIGQLTVEGQGTTGTSAYFRRVLPGYFDTLGVPLVEGRQFNRSDDGAQEKVVIVSRSLARRFWPARRAVGQRIKVGPATREPWLRVIGVVGDVRNGALEQAADLATYEPHRQRPWNGMMVMVRTTGEPEPMADSVRRALRELEPQVIVSELSTMDERVELRVALRRFHAVVVGAFATATLILAALSLYGVLAYSLASRMRELGVRSALGATAAALTRESVIEGIRPAFAGLAFGLAAAAFAASATRALLFQITPGDRLTYIGTAALLLGVALVSTWIPARRAAKIDPSVALRLE